MKGRLFLLLGGSFFGALLFGGCETDPASAFPTAQRVVAAGVAGNATVGTLARGRKIFTTTCTECHVAQPIARFSVEQWKKTVSTMAPRARLEESDRAAVEAYVTAAHSALPRS